MYSGHVTQMDADDAWTGMICSLTFDVDFTLLPNPWKTKDTHPDYIIEGRSPKGRSLQIGSAWAAKSRAGNDYLQLAFNLHGQPPIRVNAVGDEKLPPNKRRIIPLKAIAAAA